MSDTSKNPSVSPIARLAAHNVAKIREVFHDQPAWRFVTGVAEEAGEFVGAFNKWSGTSRQTGTQDEMAKELADVILTAYMAAEVLGINLDEWVQRKAAIMNERGWKTRDTGVPADEPAVACRSEVRKGVNFFVQQTAVPERPESVNVSIVGAVTRWRRRHGHDNQFPLPEFLGMTPEEYADWVINDRVKPSVYRAWQTVYKARVRRNRD